MIQDISGGNRFTCVGCKIKFETSELQRNHFKTEWHLYNLKRKVCNLEPIDLISFEKIQRTSQDGKPTSRVATPQSSRPSGSDDSDADWEDVSDESEMLSRVIPINVCLFCNKKSSNVEANVRHMNLIHGFFIPEEQYMIDLESMVEYLGYKVGAGAICLWCDKEFKTKHGAQLHMLYKDHCKIMYDQDKAIEEFKDFYDYANQEHIEMKHPNQLVLKKQKRRRTERTLVAVNSSGSSSKALVSKPKLFDIHHAKTIKRFDAYRAKILLRTGMSNNNTMRSRLRLQNPM